MTSYLLAFVIILFLVIGLGRHHDDVILTGLGDILVHEFYTLVAILIT